MTAPIARRVDMLTGQKAPEVFFQALSEADNHCRELDGLRELQCRVDELIDEKGELYEKLAELRDWQYKVADALGLTDCVEGIGNVVVVRTVEEAVEFAQHYTETALAHEQDCPVFCDEDEQYELPYSCKHCGGGGCGPGTASGAYEECEWCAGTGRDHSVESAYVHAPDLRAERDEFRSHNQDLWRLTLEQAAEIERLKVSVETYRAALSVSTS